MRAIEAAAILAAMPEITRQAEHLVHVDGVPLEHAAIRLRIPLPELRGHLLAARDARVRWAATIGGRFEGAGEDSVTDDEVVSWLEDGRSHAEVRDELGVSWHRLPDRMIGSQEARFSAGVSCFAKLMRKLSVDRASLMSHGVALATPSLSSAFYPLLDDEDDAVLMREGVVDNGFEADHKPAEFGPTGLCGVKVNPAPYKRASVIYRDIPLSGPETAVRLVVAEVLQANAVRSPAFKMNGQQNEAPRTISGGSEDT